MSTNFVVYQDALIKIIFCAFCFLASPPHLEISGIWRIAVLAIFEVFTWLRVLEVRLGQILSRFYLLKFVNINFDTHQKKKPLNCQHR